LDDADPEVRGALEVRLGDIRDARFVEEACKEVDTVFHLAALIAIPYSYAAPESFVDTNVKGALNVLEGARRAKCRRVIQTSTSEVYGTPASVPIRETHPLQGQSPYSASKIAADKLCEAYHCSFGLPVVTLRPFNTYGPRQSTRAVLPTILVQLLSGNKKIKLGRLDPKRDFTFVSDTVEGFVMAGEAEGVEGQVIQLGTGRAVSVGELFDISRRIMEVDASVEQEAKRMRPEESEVMVLISDPSKAKAFLGWEPKVSLEEGVRHTISWIEHHKHLYNYMGYHI
jgi:UDP-glucose 4-epimerase